MLTVVVGIAAGWYFLFHSEWARIDTCLDRGGRWNYDAGLCEQGSHD
ncbi:hypothetical protein [Sphingomonas sp. J315]|nr:hypothetical protein [Sphingomonas sp. J315]UUX98668.1 hypothetical protein LRS08_14165 [Sphingomonas sp. J315]